VRMRIRGEELVDGESARHNLRQEISSVPAALEGHGSCQRYNGLLQGDVRMMELITLDLQVFHAVGQLSEMVREGLRLVQELRHVIKL